MISLNPNHDICPKQQVDWILVRWGCWLFGKSIRWDSSFDRSTAIGPLFPKLFNEFLLNFNAINCLRKSTCLVKSEIMWNPTSFQKSRTSHGLWKLQNGNLESLERLEKFMACERDLCDLMWFSKKRMSRQAARPVGGTTLSGRCVFRQTNIKWRYCPRQAQTLAGPNDPFLPEIKVCLQMQNHQSIWGHPYHQLVYPLNNVSMWLG